MSWTNEREEKLKELWKKGHTASQIAEILGGTTRNAVIGEELTDETCRWPIGHPYEESFYFCGRKSMEKFPYCKLHVLYAFQPKNAKEEDQITEDDIPKFIEKKIKSA